MCVCVIVAVFFRVAKLTNCLLVQLLGMVPPRMLDQASEAQRTQFFERIQTPTGIEAWMIRQSNPSESSSNNNNNSSGRPASQTRHRIVPSSNPVASLSEVICSDASKKKRLPPGETGNTARNYELFVDLIYRMLAYNPEDRIKPEEALNHAFIRSGDPPPNTSPYPHHASRRGSVDDITDAANPGAYQLQDFGTGSSNRKREALPSQRAQQR